jgi:hypothetical protein
MMKLIIRTVSLFGGEVPHRDYVMCRAGLLLIMLLSLLESGESPANMNMNTQRFRKIFNTLSILEVIFTIIMPWMVILEGILNKNDRSRNGHLLASHLFIFQAQIAGECLIMMYGERRKWMMFPFTCAANTYRGVALGTWILRVMNADVSVPRDVILPVIATGLWIYSTFVFIPKEWYPLMQRKDD